MQKAVSDLLFTVGCENPRWLPQAKNVIFSQYKHNKHIIFTVDNMSIWVIVIMHHT